MLKSYKELVAWQRTFELCARVYDVSRAFPGDERFGLTAQLRRSAVSVPSNIAEGYGRGTTRDYVHFLWNANGSICELETQLLLAQRLRFGHPAGVQQTLNDVAEGERVLAALIRSLEKKLTR